MPLSAFLLRLRGAVVGALPRRMASTLHRIRDRRLAPKFHENWTRASQKVRSRPAARSFDSLLLIVPDPIHLAGSLGDDAMISACIQQARALNPGVDIHVVVDGSEAEAKAIAWGLKAERVVGADYLEGFVDLLNRHHFSAAIAIGADIMDGHYGFKAAAMMTAMCDLADRAGISTTVMGFSFNRTPSPELGDIFNRVRPSLRFNLRDARSLERFTSFTSATAHQVADVAFELQASDGVSAATHWMADRRQHGRTLIGINIHPMLIKDISGRQMLDIVTRTASALVAVGAKREVAYLLLPHDYRKRVGDIVGLQSLHAMLAPDLGADVHLLDGRHSASALKGVAKSLDGVVAGRMHLAIAALGSGVPVMCVTYQDKFEGLFAHFDLPEWLMITPETLINGPHLEQRLLALIDERDTLRESIANRLLAVLSLSRDNFKCLPSGAAVD